MLKSFKSPVVASCFCFLAAILSVCYAQLSPVPEKKSIYAVELAKVEIPEVIPEPEIEETVKSVTLVVNKGDTLASLMASQDIGHQEVHLVSQTMKKVFRPKDLKPGHEINLAIEKEENGQGYLVSEMRLRPSFDHEVVVLRDDEKGLVCEKCAINLVEEKRWGEAVIQGSLYETASGLGVPNQIIHNMIRAYSYDIDFQRGLQAGDRFNVMYSVKTNPQTGDSQPGDLLYASISTNGKPHQIYRYQPKGGKVGFFNEDGESNRKGLLKTPVDGARLSSGFGKRKHPILGYTKHHKGVDFACPTGTVIRAAGDGVIESLGNNGGYGRYIRIRHQNGYKTAYAHLSRYANVKRGMSVKQGTIIGYVGATGRATGPHLHYEVLKDGTHINPLSVKLVPAVQLKGNEKEQFEKAKKQYQLQYAKLKETTTVAAVEGDTQQG